MTRVIEGPCGMGNQFGYWAENRLSAGMFAIVEDGEYANGGHGPFTVDGKYYTSREAAEAAMSTMLEMPMSREKAQRILGGEFIAGVDYYLRTDGGREELRAWGYDDPLAVNTTDTSWA